MSLKLAAINHETLRLNIKNLIMRIIFCYVQSAKDVPVMTKLLQTAGLVRITNQLESIYGTFIDMKDINSVGA